MKFLAKTILVLEAAFFVALLLAKFSLFSTLFSEKKVLDFTGEKAITVSDNGLEHRIMSQAPNVGEALAQNNIPVSEKDELFPAKDTGILPGMTIFINRPANIKIAVDGKNVTRQTFAKTVSDALSENGVTLSHVDRVEPALEVRLSDNLAISVTRIKTEEVALEEDIDFKEVEQKDNQVDWGEKKITQTGEKGIRETTYQVHYENGEEVSRKKLATKITQSPVTQIVKIGTRLRIGKSDSGIASWYNAGENECASRDFPAGTWLRVTNRANGKQTYVRVAGYGPQAATGKLIDLDNKIFKQLAPLGQGTFKAKVEEILNSKFSPP